VSVTAGGWVGELEAGRGGAVKLAVITVFGLYSTTGAAERLSGNGIRGRGREGLKRERGPLLFKSTKGEGERGQRDLRRKKRKIGGRSEGVSRGGSPTNGRESQKEGKRTYIEGTKGGKREGEAQEGTRALAEGKVLSKSPKEEEEAWKEGKDSSEGGGWREEGRRVVLSNKGQGTYSQNHRGRV
jgi:hypothetical protein